MSAVISAILSETNNIQLLIHTILSENISSLPPKNFHLNHFVSPSPIHSRRPESQLGLGRKQKIGIGKALHGSASHSIGAMHNSLSIHYTQSITGNLQVMINNTHFFLHQVKSRKGQAKQLTYKNPGPQFKINGLKFNDFQFTAVNVFFKINNVNINSKTHQQHYQYEIFLYRPQPQFTIIFVRQLWNSVIQV